MFRPQHTPAGRSTLCDIGHNCFNGFIYGYLRPSSLSVCPLPEPGHCYENSILSLAFVVTIAYWALLASSTSFSTPFNGKIKLFAPCIRLITLPSPVCSLGEHFFPHSELCVCPIRNFADVPRTGSVALPPYLHFHHRFIHCPSLHHIRKPALLPSVPPPILLWSPMLTLPSSAQSLQVP